MRLAARACGACACSYLEDQREVRVEALLELLRLGARHLVAREVEDLLREELQDDHVVLAQRLVRLRRVDDVRDE